MLFQDSSQSLEDRRQIAWDRKYADNTVDLQTSHLSESSSNIKHCHLEGQQQEAEAQTKRSRQTLLGVSNLFDKECQIAKNGKFASEHLPIPQSSNNNNKQSLSIGVINDENTGASSALAFRPWGTEKTEEGVERIQFEYPSNRPNSEARPFKGTLLQFFSHLTQYYYKQVGKYFNPYIL